MVMIVGFIGLICAGGLLEKGAMPQGLDGQKYPVQPDRHHDQVGRHQRRDFATRGRGGVSRQNDTQSGQGDEHTEVSHRPLEVECLFHVAKGADAFAAAIRTALEAPFSPDPGRERVREATWENHGRTLLDELRERGLEAAGQ